MTTPKSWTGPVTMISAGLIVIFVIASEDRATALASLAGISLFAAGLVMATSGADRGSCRWRGHDRLLRRRIRLPLTGR
jgi:hypothetical protein